ncbi:MAG: hypothetical protein ABI478_06145, partial [Propionivibrio sp.]
RSGKTTRGHRFLAPGTFERTLVRKSGAVKFETSMAGQPLGDLRIETAKNAFTVGYRSREIDAGQALARRASRSEHLADALLADRDVDAMIQLPGQETFAVRMKGSERWIKLAPETEPSVSIQKGWEARTSDPQGGRRTIQMAWLDDPKSVTADFKADGSVVVDGTRGSGKAFVRYQAADVPITNAREVPITMGGRNAKATIDAGGKLLRVRWSDIADGKSDPVEMATRLSPARDATSTADLLAGKLRVNEANAGAEPAVVGSMRKADYRSAAKSIAADPKQAFADLRASRAKDLDIVVQARDSGQYGRALEQLDVMIDIYGPQTDLLLHKALVQMRRGNTGSATESLAMAGKQRLPDTKAWLDEITARMKDAPDNVRQNLGRTKDFLAWRDADSATTSTARLVPITDGGRVKLQYAPQQLDMKLIAHAQMQGNDFAKATFYLPDSPALSNVDSPATVLRTMTELPTGEKIAVYKVTDVPISRYRPDFVFMDDSLAKAAVAKKVASAKPWHLHGHGGGSPSCNVDPNGPSCDKDGRDQATYFVVLNR